MCELLGMSANVPTDICFSFSGLIQRGGVTGPHRDGWGITFYEGRGCRTFRDPQPSANSEIAELVKNYPIKSKIVISHIRRANRGRVCLENTHPFSRELWGQHWTFAHNGQLNKIKRLRLNFYIPVGSTDSEYAFCWILDQIRKQYPKKPKSAQTLWKPLNLLCQSLAKKGTFNILLSDSVFLYAFCSKQLFWITRRAPFGQAHLIDADMRVDFKKETTAHDIVTVIASQPLTDNERWHRMPPQQLLIFHKGILKKFSSRKA